MNKTIGRLFFTLGMTLIPLTTSSDLENRITIQKSLERAVEITPVISKGISIASIDLGNPADQKAFVKNLLEKYPTGRVYTRRNFDLPVSSGDSLKVYQLASENTKQLVNQLGSAQIIHLSGHHYVNGSLLFGGELIDTVANKYNITSGINLEQLPVNEDARVVFLLSCFGVNVFNDITLRISKKFPNSVLLGYRMRSAPGAANARYLENFFKSTLNRDLLNIPKKELAELWIQAGQETFLKSPRRDFRAVWKEGDVLYELNRFNNKVQKRY